MPVGHRIVETLLVIGIATGIYQNISVRRAQPVDFGSEPSTNSSGVGYSFPELWTKHFAVKPGEVGYPKEFAQRCVRKGNTCGFDANDPNIQRQYFGPVEGYDVEQDDLGNWVYYPKNK